MPGVTETTHLPNQGQRIGNSLVCLLVASAGTTSVLLGGNTRARTTVLVLVVLGLLVLTVRSMRMGISYDGRGLTARTVLCTRRLAWSAVDRFEYRGIALRAHLHDGRSLRLQDYGAVGDGPAVARELEAARAVAT